MPPFPAGAIVAGKINRTIRSFDQAGAYTERSARTPEDLGVRKGVIFNRLVNQGVLIELSLQRYFLHRENLAAYQNTRRKRAIIVFLVLFIVIVFTSLLSR